MRRSRRGTLIALAAVLLTVTVSSCAGAGSPGPPPPAASAQAPAAPPAAPAPATPAAPVAPVQDVSPSGDIPDNQVFVPYTAPGGVTVSVPEGWARSAVGAATVFTDKLNSIRIETGLAPAAPTEASVRTVDVPTLQAAVPGFRPGAITTVTRASGPAVMLAYQATSTPDPVTAKSSDTADERYAFWRGGAQVVLTLSGPVGADNVDPWRVVTDSLRWP